ncbi:A24 family peptidase, partial [Pseudomonas syringae]|nr:A24 family peptidase [Pseudomonas syringae]
TDIGPRSAICGAVIIWLVLYAVMAAYEKWRGREGLGYGDVKLMAAITVWVGMEKIRELIMWAAASGIMVYVLCTVLNQRRTLDEN